MSYINDKRVDKTVDHPQYELDYKFINDIPGEIVTEFKNLNTTYKENYEKLSKTGIYKLDEEDEEDDKEVINQVSLNKVKLELKR